MKKLLLALCLTLTSCTALTASRPPISFHKERSGSLLVMMYDGWGSGIVYDKNHVVTAAHMLPEAFKQDTVTLLNFKDISMHGQFVHPLDRQDDIALIRLATPTDLPPVEWADVELGERVYMIGNTDRCRELISAGTVIELRDKQFVIDGYIWPGYSGGPVYNSEGQVVGMTVMFKRTPSNRINGIAVTSDEVLESVRDILEQERVDKCLQLQSPSPPGWRDIWPVTFNS